MSKPTGNPNGRPTKYDAKIHVPVIRKLAERGLTEEDMASVLDVATSTLSLWKVEHPEFSEAIAEGKQNPIRDVEDALYRLCKGYTYQESGQTRVKHPDVRAIQFYLKNVAPDRWRDTQHHEHTGKDGGPIEHDLRTHLLARYEGRLVEDAEGGSESDT